MLMLSECPLKQAAHEQAAYDLNSAMSSAVEIQMGDPLGAFCMSREHENKRRKCVFLECFSLLSVVSCSPGLRWFGGFHPSLLKPAHVSFFFVDPFLLFQLTTVFGVTISGLLHKELPI